VDNFLTKTLPTGIVSEKISAVLKRRTMQQKISAGFFAFSSDFYRGKRAVEQSCLKPSSFRATGLALPRGIFGKMCKAAAPICNQTVSQM
jgi:hypothetical protein